MTEEQTTPTFEEPHWDRDLASLYIKMSRVMGHLERVPKRGQNQHFNYAYVTDSDVLGAVRKAMAKEGLAFFVDVGELEKEGKNQKAHLAITFCDGETGATKTIHWVGEAMDSQDKGISKAITAGVKYALLKTFLMSTGEGDDPDGGGAESPSTEHAPAPDPHWITDPNVRARFWGWTGSTLGLTHEQVHQALGVEHVEEFDGAMDDAKAAILKWVDEQSAAGTA